ncbi:hybrid sensor histidine kinase/response regulator [Odoribacter sp. OttesenSCG-928-A06]|nr:hybrid sensor histidine kinase/response regulator [Odoribacter sp. OttesenSCG-928-A06]
MAQKKLLVVSSSNEEVRQINRFLETGNYHVRVMSYDECNALNELNNVKPDFIIVDIRATGASTCEFIRKIRKNIFTSFTPIIIILDQDDNELFTSCLQYPLIDFITTPIKEYELLFRLEHLKSLIEARKTIHKQNEKLRQTVLSQEKLFSIIAHDLRSPIGTIKMINESILMDMEKIEHPEVRRKIEMINDTTEEAYNLLENLLRWSKNQNGETTFEPIDFNLHVAVREVASLFRSNAKNKNITLNNQVDKSIIVHGDEDMIKTVLRNLISNAIKFTFPGGEINLSVTENKQQVEIAVADTGRGIKKEYQKKLLKEGMKETQYGTKNEKGSGLGLILCRDFVRMNHGKFYFTSEEGKGSTFYFTLPKA